MQFPQKYDGMANGGLAIGIWRLVLEGLVFGGLAIEGKANMGLAFLRN